MRTVAPEPTRSRNARASRVFPMPGIAGEDDAASGAVTRDAVEGCVELRELAPATDDRRLEVACERLGPRIEAKHAVTLARLVRHDVDGFRHEPQRLGAEHQVTRRRMCEEPPDRVELRRLAAEPFDRGQDDEPRRHGLARFDHRAQRARGVVVVRLRSTEHGDELFGKQLLDGSAVPFDHHRDLRQRSRGRPACGGAGAVEVDDLHDRDDDVPLERLVQRAVSRVRRETQRGIVADDHALERAQALRRARARTLRASSSRTSW